MSNVEIHGEFTDIYRFSIACTEMEIQITNQTPISSPFLSHICTHSMLSSAAMHVGSRDATLG